MQWEYKILKYEIDRGFIDVSLDEGKWEREINKLGRDGWELVNSFGANDTDGMTNYVLMTFKRMKGKLSE
ncbi:MAG TPA: DUF4177 domain-containing protein [Salinivirgaceae bacterium]|jgi:hypothetical protein|nr:DUF4177 domain-containing protein [Salinivirgaceae bacterium]